MAKTRSGRSRNERAQLLRAAFLRPKNLLILGTGCAAAFIFAYPLGMPIGIVLIPSALLAYGLLCYIDFNNEEFVNAALHPMSHGAPARKTLQSPKLTIAELHQLHARLASAHERLQQLYQDPTMRAEQVLGDPGHINSLIEKSKAFIEKAQSIQVYLNAQDVGAIQDEIERFQQKIEQMDDEFAQRQYQQALEARYKQLDTLRDIQRMYERLVSQVTNVNVSLEGLHVRVMKLKTAEYSLAQLESEHLSAQLTDLLEDVEQLERALREVLV